jgi:hypothetical protein
MRAVGQALAGHYELNGATARKLREAPEANTEQAVEFWRATDLPAVGPNDSRGGEAGET